MPVSIFVTSYRGPLINTYARNQPIKRPRVHVLTRKMISNSFIISIPCSSVIPHLRCVHSHPTVLAVASYDDTWQPSSPGLLFPHSTSPIRGHSAQPISGNHHTIPLVQGRPSHLGPCRQLYRPSYCLLFVRLPAHLLPVQITSRLVRSSPRFLFARTSLH